MRVLAAPDKFRGTLTASEAAAAIAAGAARAGWEATRLPLADGGEGTLDVLGGGNRSTVVTGPLGAPVEAAWRLDDGVALIEAAQACGLSLAGGAEGNDPLRATSRGVGELIAAAVAAGAERVVVTVGGVASTDGGVGAVEALGSLPFRSRSRTTSTRAGSTRPMSSPRRRERHRSRSPSYATASRRSTFPTCREPALQAGSPAVSPHSARRSSPASISSPAG